jgi:MFS family permease
MTSAVGGQWRAVLRRPILPLAVFANIFAWAVTTVTLPFYVQELAGDPQSALHWVGWILGITPLLAVTTTPVWLRLTRDWNPRTAFVVSTALQGIPLALLPLVPAPAWVFVMRAILGLGGPSNTFAFLMAGRSRREGVAHEVAAMQSAINLALIVGPLAGSFTATFLGYPTTFLISAVVLGACAAVVRVVEPLSPVARARPGPTERAAWNVVALCLLVIVSYAQVFFLNAILPGVLPRLGVPPERMLPVTGWLLFATAFVLAVGALAAPAMSKRFGETRVVLGCVTVSSLLLTAVGPASDLRTFAGLWLLHVLSIAPIFSIVTARVAVWTSGQALGLVNVSRVTATFFAPVAATTLLAASSVPMVFTTLGVLGLASGLVVSPSWRRMTGGADGVRDGVVAPR